MGAHRHPPTCGQGAVGARTSGGHPDPVEVTCQLLRDVGLAARWQPDHHDEGGRVGHVGCPRCRKTLAWSPADRQSRPSCSWLRLLMSAASSVS